MNDVTELHPGETEDQVEPEPETQTIEEMAAEDEGVPEPPPLKSDAAMNLSIGGKRQKISNTSVSLMSKAVPLDGGGFNADDVVDFVVRCRVNSIKHDPERVNGEVVGYKTVISMRPLAVERYPLNETPDTPPED